MALYRITITKKEIREIEIYATSMDNAKEKACLWEDIEPDTSSTYIDIEEVRKCSEE